MAQDSLSEKEMLRKAADFCAYRERTQDEVREKLRKIGVFGDQAEVIICQLIEADFINEERFAKAFAGGKFRLKKWGKRKIRYALRQKGISDYCIQKGLEEIDDNDYFEAIQYLLEKKKIELSTKESHPIKLEKRLYDYAVGKGYESDLVRETLKKLN